MHHLLARWDLSQILALVRHESLSNLNRNSIPKKPSISEELLNMPMKGFKMETQAVKIRHDDMSNYRLCPIYIWLVLLQKNDHINRL